MILIILAHGILAGVEMLSMPNLEEPRSDPRGPWVFAGSHSGAQHAMTDHQIHYEQASYGGELRAVQVTSFFW
jgi:hypothetical protein